MVALLVFGLIGSASARAATFEQVGTFAGITTPPANPGEYPEEVQLGGVGGMAINIDGVGGVPAGTLYAATLSGSVVRVARFNPDGSFSEAWEVTAAEGPYERCGPDGEPAHPQCPVRPSALAGTVDVDVDQTTGNVYVFSTEALPTGGSTVRVYSPDGSEVITRFGEKAALGDTTASTPAKVHGSPYPGGIAVNSAGEVYVFDVNFQDSFYHRLMVFKPQSPGDYEHYVYAGQGNDLGVGTTTGSWPSEPIVDAAGNIYVAGYEGNYIEKYDPTQPASPVCGFELKAGGITAYTVNPDNGGVFFYTYKDKRVHQLAPCSGGKFAETGPTIAIAQKRDDIYAMTFDPDRQFSLTRLPGVLYGAAPGPVPSTGPGEPGMGALGYIFAPVEEIPPVIEAQSVSGVGATSAELNATIDPNGSATSYVFQFISDSAFKEGGEDFEEAEEAPLGGGEVGGGQKGIAVGVTIAGLAPDTEYHYRVIATSNCSGSEPEKVCEVVGAAQSFKTFSLEAAMLPDGRVWELVSPAQKNSGQVLPAEPITSTCAPVECKPGAGYNHFPMQSSADGNGVVYEGTPFTPSGGAVIENEYISRRTESGWSTANITPPLLQSKGGQGYKVFDHGLHQGVLEQTSPSFGSAPTGYTNLYRQPTATPLELNPLVAAAPEHRTTGTGVNSFKTVYAGASADLSRVFFEANDALTGATAFAPAALDGGEGKRNLYEWANGQLNLVNVLPGNATTTPGGAFGSGTLLKSGNPNSPAIVVAHAVSGDGSRVFWSSEAGQVYVRIDGEETIEIENSGKYLSASSDGSEVLLANGCLYDLEEAVCEDLSAGKGGFQGIIGQSDDLSRIYFVDTAALPGDEENSEGDKAQAGKPNLYAWVEGATSFVATLVVADSSDWEAAPSVRTAEASPNGDFAAFLSEASLTGHDNVGPCKIISGTSEFEDGPCAEVFLYDSVSDELICASCNPSGAAPIGQSFLRLIKDATGSLAQPRYLTNSGRLYFDSRDSLVPADTNGDVEDVYQYEPRGIGSCQREGGCVALISAGREGVDSNFLAADASGDNVFFTTRDRLVPADQDELIDLYDARVDGGFPAAAQGAPIPCQGETCQPVSPPPSERMPNSTDPTDGNVKPPKHCRNGQVKKNGRCVKKASHKKSKGKRSKHNPGGSK